MSEKWSLPSKVRQTRKAAASFALTQLDTLTKGTTDYLEWLRVAEWFNPDMQRPDSVWAAFATTPETAMFLGVFAQFDGAADHCERAADKAGGDPVTLWQDVTDTADAAQREQGLLAVMRAMPDRPRGFTLYRWQVLP